MANDPFFGRADAMLATNQLEENLKLKLNVRLYGELDDGTAVVSSNCAITSVRRLDCQPRTVRSHTAHVSASVWNALRWPF
jgi:hypothetical protein